MNKLSSKGVLTPQEQAFTSYTGFFLGNLGKYDSCRSTPGMIYYMVNISLGPITETNLPISQSGVCSPTQCTPTDMSIFFQSGQYIPAILPLPLIMNFTDFEVIKSTLNKSYYSRQWGWWLFFGIIIFFSLIGIVCTILNQMSIQRKARDNADANNKKKEDTTGTVVKENYDQGGAFQSQNNTRNEATSEQKEKEITSKEPETPELKEKKNFQNLSTVLEDKTIPLLENKKPKDKTVNQAIPSTMNKIIESWDIIERFKSISVSKRPTVESGAFDLVRLLSMSWVIMAHQYSQRGLVNTSDLMNPSKNENTANDWNVTLIEHGFYAVDFFLFMGGYVAIISLGKIINEFKNSAYSKLPILYIFIFFKRYYRIIPMLG